MAKTSFSFHRRGYDGASSTQSHIVVDGSEVTEDLTPGASNTQTTATAPALGGKTACRVTTDTTCYVAFGANPNAASGTKRFLLLANTSEVFFVNPGDKGACAT